MKYMISMAVMMVLTLVLVGCPQAPIVSDTDDIDEGTVTDDIDEGTVVFFWSPFDQQKSAGVQLTLPEITKGGPIFPWEEIISIQAEKVDQIQLYFTDLSTGEAILFSPEFNGEGFIGEWKFLRGSYRVEIWFNCEYRPGYWETLFYGSAECIVSPGLTTVVEVQAALNNGLHVVAGFVDYPEEIADAQGAWVYDQSNNWYGSMRHDSFGTWFDGYVPWDFTSGVFNSDNGISSNVGFTWSDMLYSPSGIVDFFYVGSGSIEVSVDLVPPTEIQTYFLAAVKSEDGCYHIFSDGTPAYESRFENVMDFHEGLAAAKITGEGWCHIYTDGTPAYPERYYSVGDFHDGLAAVAVRMGQINSCYHVYHDGTPAYSQRYPFAGEFHEGLAVVGTATGTFQGTGTPRVTDYCHIYTNGTPAYDRRYKWVGNFSEGLAVVWDIDEGCFHINISGQPAYDQRFAPYYGSGYADISVGDFHEGWAIVKDQNQFYHIANDGSPAYDDRFFSGRDFSEGLASVRTSEGWIFISPDGNIELEVAYSTVGNFHEGLAIVSEGGFMTQYFHMDLAGTPVYQERYNQVSDFHNGFAQVEIDDQGWCHITPEGAPAYSARFVWVRDFIEL